MAQCLGKTAEQAGLQFTAEHCKQRSRSDVVRETRDQRQQTTGPRQ